MPLPRPPPKGGTGGKPIIPGASPRRRCPTAGATGFGFLASNQGITNTPGTAHAPTAGHLRGLAAHITRTGRTKAEPAREGSREGLPSCQKPPNPPGGPGTAASALEAAPSTLQEPGAVGCAWEAHPAPQGGRGRQGPAGLTRRRPGPAGYVASNSTGTPQPEAGCGGAQATSPGPHPSTLPDLHTRVPARLAAHTPSTRWPACSGHCRGMRRRSVPRIPTQASSSLSQDTQPSRLAPSRSQPDPVPFAVMAVPVLPSPSPPKARTGSSMPCPKLRLWGPAS